jgi:hypothetical protein
VYLLRVAWWVFGKFTKWHPPTTDNATATEIAYQNQKLIFFRIHDACRYPYWQIGYYTKPPNSTCKVASVLRAPLPATRLLGVFGFWFWLGYGCFVKAAAAAVRLLLLRLPLMLLLLPLLLATGLFCSVASNVHFQRTLVRAVWIFKSFRMQLL